MSTPAGHLPLSTYRLQISDQFTLWDARDQADYLRDLGADWLYLSPLLQASAGSQHGYDVVDPSRVDASRGGPEALDALASHARERHLGLLVDVVPNHVGVAHAHENPWWWDVLLHGPESRFAQAFDIEWDAGEGRVRLPILGDDGVDALHLSDGELRYHEHRFPIAPGTGEGSARQVHDRQHYELVHYSRADHELNYRRFFAVNSLAGLRVEVPWVFTESHREVLRWVREGLVQGLRIDHPDGLADPGGYLAQLRTKAPDAYVVVEKILEGAEVLPPSWPVEGTTGYDALGDFDRVLVSAAGQEELDRLETQVQGQPVRWADLVHDSKRRVADTILGSEVRRVARLIPGASVDALAEILACFPVYRSYLPFGREELDHALAEARMRRPDLADDVAGLAGPLSDPAHPAAIRFQQTSGMVMAKGVEDSAFYRVSRLSSLTEVGADPNEFCLSVAQFHHRQRLRQASAPRSMTTLSTHDTKRGEDVRARIAVISECPEVWAEFVHRVRALAPLGNAPFESLLWQAVVGSWPASRERLHAYAVKAAREAGTFTGWVHPDDAMEGRLALVVDAAFDHPEVAALIRVFADQLSAPGWSNALSAKLLQLTGPGVPDVYQGSELWEQSLVDPDNRRPVDFAYRRELLTRIDSGWFPPVDETGAAKLLVTSRALRARRDQPELWWRYLPIPVWGDAAEHAVVCDRGGAITVATRLPWMLADRGGWGDTRVELPAGSWLDEISGSVLTGGVQRVGRILASYPVALLRRYRPGEDQA